MDSMVDVELMRTLQVPRARAEEDSTALNVPGVPARVEWSAIAEFLTGLGIDLKHISQDGVRIGWNSIECTVFATNGDGRYFLDRRTGEGAVHHIHIPVIHDEKV